MIDYDYTLCPDIAEAEGIPDPAFVEKDFFVVQLLKLLQNFNIDGYQVIQMDQKQYKNSHSEFQKNPYDEFKFTFSHLQKDDVFKKNYQDFLDPMVYHPNPPSWEEVVQRFGLLLKI